MKKIISIVLFFHCNMIFSQNDCEKDTLMYSIAHNYITKDNVNYGKRIIISDSIVDIDGWWFLNDLIDFPKEKEKLKQYWLNKNFIAFEPFYSICIASMLYKKNTSERRSIVFFSPIENNFLFADIFILSRYNPFKKSFNELNYNEVSRQTTGQHYLFIFNENNTIKAVFYHETFND